MKILLVEDEVSVASFIKLGLEAENNTVDVADNGEEGLHLAKTESYELIILDVVLPNVSGIDICLEVRKQDIDTPILMLTTKTEVKDKVKGLDSGADDYLSKPFSFDELLARIRSITRRKSTPIQKLKIRELHLNKQSRRVFLGTQEIHLRPKEYAILEYLMLNKEQVMSRTKILENVWGYDFDPNTNLIDVHIRTLRSKIAEFTDQEYICTVRGLGYLIE